MSNEQLSIETSAPACINLESVNRISKLPVVESTLQTGKNIYGKVKDYNGLTNWTISTAENTAYRAVEIGKPFVAPVVHSLEGPIKRVDGLICSGLDYVEEKLPAVKLPPGEIVNNTKDYMNNSPTIQMAKHVVEPAMETAKSTVQGAKNMVEPAFESAKHLVEPAIQSAKNVVESSMEKAAAVREYGNQKLEEYMSSSHRDNGHEHTDVLFRFGPRNLRMNVACAVQSYRPSPGTECFAMSLRVTASTSNDEFSGDRDECADCKTDLVKQ